VTQGKTVVVVFEHGGLTITTNALALQNGGLGDVVSLRNLDSGAIIKGTVASNGSIQLDAP
jgi:flagella basal body P-ring formation protein FlgA